MDTPSHGEAAVRRSEERFRQMADTIPEVIWITSLEPERVLYTSPSFERIWGLKVEELYRNPRLWTETIHPEDRDRVVSTFSEWIAGTKINYHDVEYRIVRPDGTIRWIHERGVLTRDKNGRPVEVSGISTDITTAKQAQQALENSFQEIQLLTERLERENVALKHAEAKLRQDEEELRRMTDAIPQTIVVLDPSGAPIYANQATLDYTGLTIEDVLAPGFRERIFHPDDLEKWRDEREAALARGLPFEAEQRALRKDGQYRWFLIRYNPFRTEQEQVIRWYATGTDIDDRFRAAERIRNENLALREQIDRESMFEDIVGSSEALRKVLRQVTKVAPSDSTVLILGETGTGKELIARAIHKRSRRAEQAFIGVNCAAIPASLIASELFGHEKGACKSAKSSASAIAGRFRWTCEW